MNFNAIVRSAVIVHISVEDVGGIPNTALSVGIVLARTPLPNLPIIDVSLTRRMVEAQESARKDWDGILVVGDTRKPASEFAVDVVGEILVSDLRRKGVRPSIFPVGGSPIQYALVEVHSHNK